MNAIFFHAQHYNSVKFLALNFNNDSYSTGWEFPTVPVMAGDAHVVECQRRKRPEEIVEDMRAKSMHHACIIYTVMGSRL